MAAPQRRVADWCSLLAVTISPSDSTKGVSLVEPLRTYVALEGPKFKCLRVPTLGPFK